MNKGLLTNYGILCNSFNKEDLTHTYISKPGTKPIRIENYSYDELYFRKKNSKLRRIPRHYAFQNYDITIDESFIFGDKSENVRRKIRRAYCKIKLDNNQKIMFKKIMKEFLSKSQIRKGLGSTILQMPTGSGKTYLSLKLMAEYGFKTLIMAPKGVIDDSWLPAITDNFPYSNVSTDYKSSPDILLCTVNTVYGHVEELRDYKMIIIDEIHRVPTPKFHKILWLTAPVMVGMTATPDERVDGFDIVYKQHLGDVIYAEEIENYNISDHQFQGLVKKIIYRNPKYNVEHYSQLINKLCDDEKRSKVICKEVKRLYRKNMNIYVFSDRVEYLFKLKDNTFPRNDTVYVISGSKNSHGLKCVELFEKANKDARIIFGTYQVFSEGISINRMDAIILATPRKNKMRQILGRILRRDGDRGIIREIVDICDVNTMCKNQWLTRSTVYDEKGYDVEKYVVSITN